MLRPSASRVEEQLVSCTLTFLQAFHGLVRLVIEPECKLTTVPPLLRALWHQSCYSIFIPLCLLPCGDVSATTRL